MSARANDEQQTGDAEESGDPPASAPRRRGGKRAAAAAAGGGKRLVIVESPAKARTIGRFLGPGYVVESSIGHIRDLPSTAAEVPAGVTGESRRLGVDVEHDFAPVYVIPAGKKQQVTKLRKLLRDADELYLATDEDREGEAIAWHLREVLKPRVPVRRMVFHEITQQAIEEALASPREVDEQLVEAQEARRILDRLFGYEVSPVLWKKVRPRLSAGRVQSAATRIIVDRERERMRFVRSGYWDLDATLATREPATAEAPATLRARLVEARGKRVATGRDFDAATGQLAADADVTLLDEALASTLAAGLRGTELRVASVTERPYTQRPPAPFVTSTLQQEAARQLRFTAQRAMQVAQHLYENGFITYMRTDSTQLSDQAISAARRQIGELYGAEYLPDGPRRYTARGRGAQEAHEAIRPAGEILRTPESLARELAALGPDAPRLYELVWKRTVASQMRDAQGVRTQVRIESDARGTAGESEPVTLAASGKVIRFPGFLRAYVEGSDDPDAELEDQERLLPPLSEGQPLDAREVEARGHETQPPARYTEASLVRELEERGIGRPSTYAAILQTIQDRGYATRRGTQLVPSFTAFAVVQLLERHFAELVDLEFTARMEGRPGRRRRGSARRRAVAAPSLLRPPRRRGARGRWARARRRGRAGRLARRGRAEGGDRRRLGSHRRARHLHDPAGRGRAGATAGRARGPLRPLRAGRRRAAARRRARGPRARRADRGACALAAGRRGGRRGAARHRCRQRRARLRAHRPLRPLRAAGRGPAARREGQDPHRRAEAAARQPLGRHDPGGADRGAGAGAALLPQDAGAAPRERRARHRAGRPARPLRAGRRREPQPARRPSTCAP